MENAGQTPPDAVVAMANAYNSKRKEGMLLGPKDHRTSGFKSGRGIALEAKDIAAEGRKKKARVMNGMSRINSRGGYRGERAAVVVEELLLLW